MLKANVLKANVLKANVLKANELKANVLKANVLKAFNNFLSSFADLSFTTYFLQKIFFLLHPLSKGVAPLCIGVDSVLYLPDILFIHIRQPLMQCPCKIVLSCQILGLVISSADLVWYFTSKFDTDLRVPIGRVTFTRSVYWDWFRSRNHFKLPNMVFTEDNKYFQCS